jgi:transcription termination/antitermination protein NusG
MNKFEQTLPEEQATENPDTLTEGVAENDAPAANVSLDITMGDMETDLPTAAEETKSPAEEMEIPWGELNLAEESEAEPEVEAGTDKVETTGQAPASAVAEGDATEAEEGPPIRRVWYVVHCYSGYENKVKKGLEQRINSMGLQDYIYRVVVPVEREVEIREGQRKNIERRVFPGYILVEMMELVDRETLSADAPEWLQKRATISDEVWYAVRNTPGVTGFVSSGDQQRPVPLRQEEVDKILKRMESEEPKVHVTFRVGQTVHIIDGPFADFRGQVDAVDMTKGKVRVLVSFFGRETPVELDLLQVEKV